MAELFASHRVPVTGIPASKIGAELHHSLIRVFSILILPFLAIPLGITNQRTDQAWGIGASLILLVAFEKILQVGKTLGAGGMIPAWSGAWLPFVGLAIIGVILFRRAAYTVSEPPLAGLSGWAGDMFEMLADRLRSQIR